MAVRFSADRGQGDTVMYRSRGHFTGRDGDGLKAPLAGMSRPRSPVGTALHCCESGGRSSPMRRCGRGSRNGSVLRRVTPAARHRTLRLPGY